MAYEHFARRDSRRPRPFADKALKLKPHHPLASYVKARLLDDDRRRRRRAGGRSSRPSTPSKPDERVIDLLAELQMKAGKLDEAERLYELARKDDPVHTKWIAGLARVHLRQEGHRKFLTDLAMIADNDADDLDVRKAPGRAPPRAADHPDQAEKWATECLYIDVYDPGLPRPPGRRPAPRRRSTPRRVEEYQTALDLKAKKPNDLKVRLAQALAALGKPRRGQGDPRRRPQGRPRPPRGQGAAGGGRGLRPPFTQ